MSSAQVILRWSLQKGMVVIPSSSNPDHIRENTELYDFELTEDEMARIGALARNEKHEDNGFKATHSKINNVTAEAGQQIGMWIFPLYLLVFFIGMTATGLRVNKMYRFLISATRQ